MREVTENPRQMSKASFEQVYSARNWHPISHCPGRFVLRGSGSLSVEAIAGREIEVTEYRTDAARDPVLVAALDGGGIISYRHLDGALVHTLNTDEGFERKLKQLGIEVRNLNMNTPVPPDKG
jgi:hypothetical protein